MAGAGIEVPGLVTVKNLARRIVESHSDFISLVPTQLAELLKDQACLHKLKQFRTILLGGAASSSDLIGQIKQLKLPVLSSYGMTETAAHVSCTTHSDSEDKLASVGRALPGVNFEINSEGILIIRGPQVCKAYLNGKQFDGVLVTNDRAQIDSAGYLHILGRSDRMIISGGENIPAAQIELCAEQICGVKSAAVLSQSDPKWGQTPVLFLEISGEVSAEELLVKLREHFKLNLPRYMYPSRIEVLQEMPRTGIGKINYRALQDILLPAASRLD